MTFQEIPRAAKKSLDSGVHIILLAGVLPYSYLIVFHFTPSTTTRRERITKAELIEGMAKDAGISKAAATKALQSFLGNVAKGLEKRNSRVTLVGFGTFKNKYRKTRMGFNPQTGEKIKIKGKNVVSFKPGKSLQ